MKRTKLSLKETSIGGGEKMWCVTWPKAGSGRNRQFFKNQAEARTLYEQKEIEKENFGRAGMGLTDRERYEFHEYREALKPWGKSLRDAFVHYVDYLEANEQSCTAAELVAELLKAKRGDGLSEVHLRDIRCRLKPFADKFNGQTVATITSAEIDDWLRSLPFSPFTRNRYRALVVLAFNFAVQKGYAKTNPAIKTTKAKVIGKAPGILTVQQTADLLKAASPELLPYVAIGAFAGLRSAELKRLDWSEIDFESGLIRVEAEKAKTARKRFVPMQPNLCEWLMPYRKRKGPVTPQENFRNQFDQVRIAAGFKDDEGRLAHWPDNALRHSFASYHLAHFKDAKSLALDMGHTDTGMIFNHYRELVKPADAKQFWQIRPNKG